MVSAMAEDINKVKIGFFGRLLSYSFIFMIIYIVLFIVIATTGNMKYYYIPMIFFLLFFISLFLGICYR